MACVPVCVHDGWGLSPDHGPDVASAGADGSGWISRYSRFASGSSGMPPTRSMVRPSGSLLTVPPSVYQNLPSAGNP